MVLYITDSSVWEGGGKIIDTHIYVCVCLCQIVCQAKALSIGFELEIPFLPLS